VIDPEPHDDELLVGESDGESVPLLHADSEPLIQELTLGVTDSVGLSEKLIDTVGTSLTLSVAVGAGEPLPETVTDGDCDTLLHALGVTVSHALLLLETERDKLGEPDSETEIVELIVDVPDEHIEGDRDGEIDGVSVALSHAVGDTVPHAVALNDDECVSLADEDSETDVVLHSVLELDAERDRLLVGESDGESVPLLHALALEEMLALLQMEKDSEVDASVDGLTE